MTAPTQAVEAVLHRDQDGTFSLRYEGDEQIYDVAMRNSPLAKAMDAYVGAALTSQQEVVRYAIPAGARELIGDVADDSSLNDELRNWAKRLLAQYPAWGQQEVAAPVSRRKPLNERQIERGWKETFSTGNPFCPCDLKSFTKAVRWSEQFWENAAPKAQEGGK